MSRKEVIGDATLYLGECMDILPTLPKVDAVITAPPYGIGESSKNHKSRNRVQGGKPIASTDYGISEWDNKPPTDEELRAVIGVGRRAVLWGGNYFGLPAASKWLVWDKVNSGDFADCELAWTNLPGAVRMVRHMWNGMLRDSERGTPRVHPTQKPVAVMRWCIEQAGDAPLILDPYMGSGSIGVAAVEMGRAYIGIERETKYFDIACRRLEQAYKQRPLFDAEPQRKPEQLGLEGAC